jgi:hypothetical protein
MDLCIIKIRACTYDTFVEFEMLLNICFELNKLSNIANIIIGLKHNMQQHIMPIHLQIFFREHIFVPPIIFIRILCFRHIGQVSGLSLYHSSIQLIWSKGWQLQWLL